MNQLYILWSSTLGKGHRLSMTNGTSLTFLQHVYSGAVELCSALEGKQVGNNP